MVCAKCGNKFPLKVFIDGKERNLQRRKYCLDCSPFGTHNTARLERLVLTPEEKREARKKYGRGRLMVQYLQNRREKVQRTTLSLLGNACEICGYNRCRTALEFHHINPQMKEFAIGNGMHYSKERLEKEIKKCALLCANCHRELESGLIQLPEHIKNRV